MAVTSRPLEHAREAGTEHEWGWVLQALTGIAVLGLVTLHMIANHFVVPEGLRDFAGVVAYLSSPVIVVLEVAFLVTVTWHALLGLRSILFDFGFSPRVERAITRVLAVMGVLTVGYGLWLTALITGQG
jgi:succinate dehydrogenase / fumarate reductase, cytochrome b subunit